MTEIGLSRVHLGPWRRFIDEFASAATLFGIDLRGVSGINIVAGITKIRDERPSQNGVQKLLGIEAALRVCSRN